MWRIHLRRSCEIKVNRHIESENSKRGILRQLASNFDPLGFLGPVLLSGKIIYRDACDRKLSWDEALPEDLDIKWNNYLTELPEKIELPRSLPIQREKITNITLHAFGDASKDGVAAVLYAVVKQPSGTNQGLVASSCRLAKKETTIPRLELIAAVMAANLLENAGKALRRFPIISFHGWTDSMVALHWINGEGNYRQYVSNRVRKIRDKEFIRWKHVPGKENPADVGSRGGKVKELSELWWNGPDWLSQPECWPVDVRTSPTEETESEAKKVNTVLITDVIAETIGDSLLKKYELTKVVRIIAGAEDS